MYFAKEEDQPTVFVAVVGHGKSAIINGLCGDYISSLIEKNVEFHSIAEKMDRGANLKFPKNHPNSYEFARGKKLQGSKLGEKSMFARNVCFIEYSLYATNKHMFQELNISLILAVGDIEFFRHELYEIVVKSCENIPIWNVVVGTPDCKKFENLCKINRTFLCNGIGMLLRAIDGIPLGFREKDWYGTVDVIRRAGAIYYVANLTDKNPTLTASWDIDFVDEYNLYGQFWEFVANCVERNLQL